MDIKEAREIVNLRKKDSSEYVEAVEVCEKDDKIKEEVVE